MLIGIGTIIVIAVMAYEYHKNLKSLDESFDFSLIHLTKRVTNMEDRLASLSLDVSEVRRLLDSK